MPTSGVREQMERLLEEARAREAPCPGGGGCLWVPAADLRETPGEFVISVDLPGLSMDKVEVEIRGRELWVYGERPFSQGGEDSVHHLLECSCGPFSRRFQLEGPLEPSRVRARFGDGVLVVTVPKKRPPSRRRRIIIED